VVIGGCWLLLAVVVRCERLWIWLWRCSATRSCNRSVPEVVAPSGFDASVSALFLDLDDAMPADEPVTRQVFSGHLQPISVPHPLSQLPQRIWQADAWERIQRGHRGRDMDERWDILTEGNIVYVHRSWTGFGIFAATFGLVADGGRRIVHVDVERDPERYRSAGEEDDCVTLEFVLSAVLLGETSAALRERMLKSIRRAPSTDTQPQ
jgi:hypothetical protein